MRNSDNSNLRVDCRCLLCSEGRQPATTLITLYTTSSKLKYSPKCVLRFLISSSYCHKRYCTIYGYWHKTRSRALSNRTTLTLSWATQKHLKVVFLIVLIICVLEMQTQQTRLIVSQCTTKCRMNLSLDQCFPTCGSRIISIQFVKYANYLILPRLDERIHIPPSKSNCFCAHNRRNNS